MRNALTVVLAASLTAFASAQFPLDRTNEPRPLIITGDTDWSGVDLTDNNPTRPAVIVLKGTFKIHNGHRERHEHEDPADPGLGNTFDGTFLPRLKIGFSHHDFARAFVVLLGNSSAEVASLASPVSVLVLPSSEGVNGTNQHVTIGELSGRFGVMAAGQENLNVNIGKATQDLYSTGAPGHVAYNNECRNALTGEYLRVKGYHLKIGSVRSVSMTDNVRLDNVTVKLKGTWGAVVEDLDDQNECGPHDSFGASGIGVYNWKYPKGGTAINPFFAAFRLGGEATFGTPPGKMILMGNFDATDAPVHNIGIGQIESPLSGFAEARFTGAAPPVVWQNCDVRGLSKVMVIPR